MKYFGAGLSEKHKELSRSIRTPERLGEAKRLFLELHAALHQSEPEGGPENETDRLLSDLTPEEYAVMPTAKDETIAWAIWHMARLEDLTIGILAAEGDQLFDGEWQRRLNAGITDTGNALTDDGIMALSKALVTKELLRYRAAVGRRTREIAAGLTAADLRRRVSPAALEKLRREGGVTGEPDSAWLLSFWEKKDVAGLLLMPPTRDAMLHLNDCAKWKLALRTKKRFFRC